MDMKRVVVKYHNRRMLLTVDTNALLKTLLDAYGGIVVVELEEMDEREKAESSEAVDGLRVVRERFRVLEQVAPAVVRRRADLEDAAVAVGSK